MRLYDVCSAWRSERNTVKRIRQACFCNTKHILDGLF
jgi:hypothetical protein